MKYKIKTVAAVMVFFLFQTPFANAVVSFEGKNCYLGTMHAHTVLSPDFRPKPANMQQFRQLVDSTSEDRFAILHNPFQAYKRAADVAKLDFLAVTDHVHGPEPGLPEFCSHEMPRGGYQLIFDSAAKINSDPAFQGRFLAIPGMEWSVIAGSNHANIFFARNAVPQTIANGDFKSLLTSFLNNSAFELNNPLLLVQVNHPNQVASSISYGRNAFTGPQAERDFVSFFKNTYLGIEHINGSSNGGTLNELDVNAHQEGNSLDSHYKRYLNMGFRMAPIGDHDSHRKNWGRHSAARTGVWADGLTPEQFVEAYRERRVFATEDNEMSIAFMTGSNWMGSEVTVPAAGEVRTFRVMINQIADTDTGQVQNEGPYVIELFSDENGVGGAVAKRVPVTFNGQSVNSFLAPQGAVVEFTYRVQPVVYCFIHVKETNGLDGQGNKADAWTAPIFFVP
jgi:hypothetical protein